MYKRQVVGTAVFKFHTLGSVPIKLLKVIAEAVAHVCLNDRMTKSSSFFVRTFAYCAIENKTLPYDVRSPKKRVRRVTIQYSYKYFQCPNFFGTCIRKKNICNKASIDGAVKCYKGKNQKATISLR